MKANVALRKSWKREALVIGYKIPKGIDASHGVLQVPGRKNYRWDRYIERWVVGRLSYEEVA